MTAPLSVALLGVPFGLLRTVLDAQARVDAFRLRARALGIAPDTADAIFREEMRRAQSAPRVTTADACETASRRLVRVAFAEDQQP